MAPYERPFPASRAPSIDGRSCWRQKASSGSRGWIAPPGPVLAAAFALGLATAPAVRVGSIQWALVGAAGVGVVAARRVRPETSETAVPTRLAAWALLFAALGLVRTTAAGRGARLDEEPSPPRLSTVRGRVTSVPVCVEGHTPAGDGHEPRWRLLLDVRPSTGAADVRVVVDGIESPDPTWPRPGALVEVRGKMLAARGPRNPGELRGREGTLIARGRHAVRVMEIARPPGLGASVLALRRRLHATITRLYDSKARGLMLALLLGDRRLLDPDLRQAFVETGTFHFLAISGLHVGIVMLFFTRLPLPRGSRTCIRIGFLVLFATLTGAHPPVVRAAVMLSIHIVAKRLRRRARAVNTLGWTALALLVAQPEWLADLGFQLSFVAVFAIVTWSPRLLERWTHDPDAAYLPRALRRRRSRLCWWALGALAVAISTSSATTPLLLLHFKRFHPLAPVWTLLVYPAAVVVLLGGLGSVAAGLVWPQAGEVLAAPTATAVSLLGLLLEWAARVPGSVVYLDDVTAWRVLAAYALLGTGLVPRLRRWCVAIGLALALGLTVFSATSSRPPTLITFDVGAASSALLSVPGAGGFVVDAGSRSRWESRKLVGAILAAGRRRLAGVLVSHPQSDHMGAVPAIARCLPLGRVYVSPHFSRSRRGALFHDRLFASGIPSVVLERGDRIRLGATEPVWIDVIFPSREEPRSTWTEPNELSLGVRIRAREASILTLGDLEERGITRLLGGTDDLQADVLVLPHHGRSSGRLGELLRRVRPETVIISGNGAGGARDVARKLESSGIRVFATWRRGAIVTRLVEGRWQSTYWVDCR